MDIKEKKYWPSWRYGPNGEAQIFESEAEVPEGWLDNPNAFKKASKSKKEEGENAEVAKPSEGKDAHTDETVKEDAASPVKPSEKSTKKASEKTSKKK